MKDEPEIENNIPLPSIDFGGGVYNRAFKKMNVGDSFVIPVKDRMNAYMAGRRFGKVITRSIGNDQLRVWLVEKKEDK